MKVVHLVHSFRVGGAELIAAKLSVALAASGDQAMLLPLRPPSEPVAGLFANLQSLGVTTGTPFGERFRNPGSFIRGRRFIQDQIRAFGADVVHSHCEMPDIINASLRGPFARVRTCHNDLFLGWASGRHIERLLNRAGRFDAVIAISEQTAANNSGPWRSATIYNSLFDSTDIARVPRGPVSPGDIRVHLIGRISAQKRQLAFLAFLEQHYGTLTALPFTLHLYGVAPDPATIDAIVQRSDGRVRYEGLVSDKPALYAGASAVIIPSGYEGLSSVMVEAIAHGIPVLSMRVSGAEEIIGRFEAGAVVDSDQAMLDAILGCQGQDVEEDARARIIGLFATDRAIVGHRMLYESARHSNQSLEGQTPLGSR